MSKFCQNCGNMLEDNAAFCDKCGKPFEQADAAPQYEAPAAPQYEAPQYEAPQYGAPQYGTATAVAKQTQVQTAIAFIKAKKMLFICGAAGLIVLIILISIISGCAGNSPKGVVNNFYNAAKSLNIEKAYNYVYAANFDANKSLSDYKKEGKAMVDMMKAYGSTYDEMKKQAKQVSFNITEVKDKTKEEIESIKESKKNAGYKDTDKITDAKTVVVKVKQNSSSSENTNEVDVIKCKGKWYIDESVSSIM